MTLALVSMGCKKCDSFKKRTNEMPSCFFSKNEKFSKTENFKFEMSSAVVRLLSTGHENENAIGEAHVFLQMKNFKGWHDL